MTHDGLIEQNLSTGEETRISQRGQDFNLTREKEPRETGIGRTRNHTGRNHIAPEQPPSSPSPNMPPAATGEDNFPRRPRRLRLSREQAATGGKRYRPRYHQKLSPDAAKPGNSGSADAAKSGKLQFTADEQPPADKKLSRLNDKIGKREDKLEKARSKLPHRRRMKVERAFVEEKGKVKHKLYFEKEALPPGGEKPSLPAWAGKAAGGMVTRAGANKIHQKIHEVEKENVGVEAAHKTELAAEKLYRSHRNKLRHERNRSYRTVEKLEQKLTKTHIKHDYRKLAGDNPQLRSNPLSRAMQKQKIKRQYAKAKRTAERARKSTSAVAKIVTGFIRRHPLLIGAIAVILLLFSFVSSIFTACSNMGMGGMAAVLASSYLADNRDIDDAELVYTEWETELRLEIDNIERDYPDYDEYRYDIPEIGHDPHELMAFLTAVYEDFKYAGVQGVLWDIFNEQYELELVKEVETRYRIETVYDPNTGRFYEIEIPYEWRILNVKLTVVPFTEIIYPRMDEGQSELHGYCMESKGNRQYLSNPFDVNWLPYVSSAYGYRIHPITGVKDYHKGVDIAMSAGTEIHAGHDGVVTYAGYNGSYGYLVVIEDGEGLVSKYAHCSALLVSASQKVKSGDVIALVGSTGNSTGPHLHLEVIKDGNYLNPVYFAQTN